MVYPLVNKEHGAKPSETIVITKRKSERPPGTQGVKSNQKIATSKVQERRTKHYNRRQEQIEVRRRK